MPVEESSRFLIRAYREGDEAQILDLFERSFHVARSPEHWRWKFEENPFGARRISVAFEGERLVGHYAAYPVPFRIHGRDVEAHQIGDTMTDPSVRHIGRGPTSILGRTALHFYSNFCEGRVGFNYGFNVANIQRFSLKFLRSDRVEPVAYRIRDLRKRPMRRLTRLEKYLRGYRFELVRSVGEEWTAFFERVADSYAFLVKRDARYLRWRYLERPDADYVVVAIRRRAQLVGWLVVRVRGEMLTVGDALIDPAHPGAIELVLRHLAQAFPVSAIDGWFPPRPSWLNSTLERFFDSAPEPQDLSVMCVPFALPEAVAEMRQSLYYTMGDSDLF